MTVNLNKHIGSPSSNLAAMALARGLSPTSHVDAFLQIEGVKGESQADGFTDQIELLNWSFGVFNQGSMAAGGGGGSGKAVFNDLTCVHRIDKASPVLMLKCSNGEHIKSAVLSVRKTSGKKPLVYVKITLDDLIISSVHVDSVPESPDLMEAFTINYAKIKLEYVPQKSDGSADAGVEFKWDIKKNISA